MKLSFIPCLPTRRRLVASTLMAVLLSACSPANNQSAQTSPTANSAVASTSTTTTVMASASSNIAITAVPIDPKNFAGHETAGAMAVAMSSFMVQNLTTTSDLQKLPADKKSCLLNSNHAASLATFDSYLAKKLSTDELKKTNTFYASELGQKLIIASDQKIKQQAGLTFANPVTLNEDDTAKLKAFSTAPEGKKLLALFTPANQLDMQREVIEPMMKSEFDKCEVNVAGVS